MRTRQYAALLPLAGTIALLADLTPGAPVMPFAGLVASVGQVGSWANAGGAVPPARAINDTSSASVSWRISFLCMCFLPVQSSARVTARGSSTAVACAGRIHTPARFTTDDPGSGIACSNE